MLSGLSDLLFIFNSFLLSNLFPPMKIFNIIIITHKIFCQLIKIIPIGLAVFLSISDMATYLLIMVSCFVMMILAMLFSVQIVSYLQIIAPNDMICKIISCASCIGMCATPLGQVIYGGLFDVFNEKIYIVIFIEIGRASCRERV